MTGRAAVQRAAGAPLVIEPFRIAGTRSHDVVVRIAATSLCHTDLEAVEGKLGTPLPMVPGHEAAGVVDWVGSDVTTPTVGDRVIVSWNPHCGECFYCRRRQPILCEPYRANAARSLHFDAAPRLFVDDTPLHPLMYAGTFAEFAVVTADCAIPVGDDIPFELACLIGCGVMTGVGAAINIARVEPGTSATVIGCGAVGLSAIQGARIAGARIIVAVDRDPAKLALARVVGATHTLVADESLVAEHAALTAGRGADYVFEAAGNPSAFRASVELVRPGGQVVWLGKVPVNDDVAFRWGSLMGEKNIVRSSYGGAAPATDFPMLVDAWRRGALDLASYVTSTIGLDDVNEGLARLRAGTEIRSVITFD